MREFEQILYRILEETPDAAAWLRGSADYPEIEGYVFFYEMGDEVLVVYSIRGLEKEEKKENKCGGGFLGFHIHDRGQCTGNDTDPFADSGMHYNPGNCAHPLHAGDLPSVLVSRGRALGAALTSGFTVEEITGRTVILHAQRDDFTTQPSGDSGAKIACGRIQQAGALNVSTIK